MGEKEILDISNSLDAQLFREMLQQNELWHSFRGSVLYSESDDFVKHPVPLTTVSFVRDRACRDWPVGKHSASS